MIHSHTVCRLSKSKLPYKLTLCNSFGLVWSGPTHLPVAHQLMHIQKTKPYTLLINLSSAESELQAANKRGKNKKPRNEEGKDIETETEREREGEIKKTPTQHRKGNMTR